MKFLLSAILLFIMNTDAFSLQAEETITLNTATGDLKGSILIPKATLPLPIALIIAGSGPTDRNGNQPMMYNNSLKMLTSALYKNNIASLRYDKRGVGESRSACINENNLRFEHYIEDAKAWVRLLQKDKRFNQIIIIGHSEGSLIGIIASQEKNVDKFISIAGPGRPVYELLKEQLQKQPIGIRKVALPIIDKLLRGETVQNVDIMVYQLFRPSVQPYLISWFKYNPQQEIAKLHKPVLILQGTTDIQVTINDAELLAEANNKSEKKIIEKMNHILKESTLDRVNNIQTYNQPDLPLKQELVESIIRFIKK